MEHFFTILNRFFDIFWHTQTHGGRYVAIVLAAAVSAVIFMFIYKWFSNQEAIDREKRKITGHILDIRIYQDNLGLIFRDIFGIIKHNLLYVLHTIPPLAVIMIPLIVITMQVNNRCGYEPLEKGGEFIVRGSIHGAVAASGFDAIESLRLRTSEGIMLQTPVLKASDPPAIYARARVEKLAASKDQWIEFSDDFTPFRTKLHIAPGGLASFDPVTIRYGFFEALLHNANGFLPAQSPFSEVAFQYQREDYSFLTIDMDAVVLYFVLTLVFALMLKPVFKIRL